jgi:hypothetical protein
VPAAGGSAGAEGDPMLPVEAALGGKEAPPAAPPAAPISDIPATGKAEGEAGAGGESAKYAHVAWQVCSVPCP